jgi:class 3 adenylate cyclase
MRKKSTATVAIPDTQREELILAMTRVLASTKACADQDDESVFILLSQYYKVVASEAAKAGGRFIKGMGDGTLLTFPADDPHAVLETLRDLQMKANDLWQQFDRQCHVQLKVGIGTVVSGMLGAPGEERHDIIGDALNKLIKAPWNDFEITAELASRLK